MYTTDNKKRAKKKYTHPPMEDSRRLEDSRKLEDFEYLEYSKDMIDYDAIMDRITGISPNSKLRVKLGDEKEMLLPLNNYEIRIKVEDLGYEKSVRIRAENLSTGEVETYIKARPVANYRMCASTPYRQNFGKNDSKNEMQRNSRTQYFQDYGHKNKSFTIHVTSYKEPELISNDDISWLNDWWSTDHTYTTEYGEIYTKDGGGWNENHKSRIVGCTTSLNGIFGAFGGGTAHIMASGNWADFFEGLTQFLKQILSSSPVIHEETNNVVDPFEVSKDSAKMEIWTAYIKRDGWTGKVSSRDTVVPMSERDSLNKREDMYKDVYRIDKVKW